MLKPNVRFTSLLSLCFSVLVPLATAQSIPWSQSPPGKLDPGRVPMFVVINFDDNAYAEGMDWWLNLVRDRKNPPGTGNLATFDGSPIRSTFFLTGRYSTQGGLAAPDDQSLDAILASWRTLKRDNHEIANHTWSHPHGGAMTKEEWKEEIRTASAHIASVVGIPPESIKGFRSPFLEYSATSLALVKEMGFDYDCSTEFGLGEWQPLKPDASQWASMAQPETHKQLPWPFTLDQGLPQGNTAKGNITVPGLVEFPVFSFLKGDSNVKVTGFDYNLWKDMSKEQFVATLKRNFDLRRQGNRSPLSISGHTDYYTRFNPDAAWAFTKSDYRQRQQAMEEFLAYVLQFPETRVVTYANLLAWMKNPIPLTPGTDAVHPMGRPSAGPLRALRFPSARRVEIPVDKQGIFTLAVADITGNRRMGKTASTKAGWLSYTLDAPLGPGTYLLSLEGEGQRFQRVLTLLP